ncbi:MAG: Orotidine 5-phosphate decarboxylase [Chloroflexi bacterium]|nr:Orotidine 5-phosphate decarboxylase [Chloroflexota bacterium]
MNRPPINQSGKGSNPSPGSHSESFSQKVRRRWDRGLFLCVGLDISADKLPASLAGLPVEDSLFEFNRQIIEATAEFAAVYKPNVAFYEQSGPPGMIALKRTCDWLKSRFPELPILLDAKRGDLASTNEGYAAAFFDYYGGDAITAQPYLGAGALAPFLDRPEKGVFVLCRTSNPDSAQIQGITAAASGNFQEEPLYQRVARLAAGPEWNYNGNIGLVAGATFPSELGLIRQIAPALPLLIPGIGAQGGELGQVLENGLDNQGAGVLINASRSIIYASKGANFAEAAGREAASLAQSMREGRDRVMTGRGQNN